MDYNLFKTGEKTLTGRQEYALMRNKNTRHLIPYEFTYAYAITVWKAQGSEWNKVLLFEENFPYNKIGDKIRQNFINVLQFLGMCDILYAV